MSSKKKILFVVLGCLAAFTAAMVVFWPFGGAQHINYIPGNASMVVSLDLKELISKAKGDKLEKMKIYSKMKEEMDGDWKEFTDYIKDNPLSSGIDWTQDAFIFFSGEDKKGNGALVFKVTDKEDFGKTIRKAPKISAIKSDKNYNYVEAGGKNSLIGWNDEVGVIAFGDSDTDKFLSDVLMQDKKENLKSKNKVFNQFLDTKHDIGFFVNHNSLIDFLKAIRATNEMAIQKLEEFKDGNSVAYLNFENGHVDLDFSYLPGDPSKANPYSVKKEGISDEMIKNITDKDVYGILAMNLDIPKIISGMKTNKEYEQGLKQIQEQLGLSEKEVEEIFSGEMVFAFLGIRESIVTRNTYNWETFEPIQVTDTIPLPVFTLNIGIKDKAAWEKVSSQLVAFKDSASGFYNIPLGLGMNSKLVVTKNGLSMSNDVSVARAIADGTLKGKMKKEMEDLVKQNGMAGYFTFLESDYSPETLELLKNSMGERSFGDMKAAMKIFKNVTVKSRENGMSVQLNLNESENNSLSALLNHIDEQAKF